MSAIYPKLKVTGENALTLYFNHALSEEVITNVAAFADHLINQSSSPFIDVVPANVSVTVFYNPLQYGLFQSKKLFLEALAKWQSHSVANERSDKVIELPAYYGLDVALDAQDIVERTKLDWDRVISLHQSPIYIVSAVGFSPGFPYLEGLCQELNLPRKNTPRISVPKGSIAIAGGQTSIYPQASPGGWHVVGRCPVPFFNPQAEQPALLKMGDRVRFYAITKAEYERKVAAAGS